MAQVQMQLATITWDTAQNTITLTFLGDDQPPPPVLADGVRWIPGSGSQLVMTAPVRKLTENPATAYTLHAEGDRDVERKYEYVNGSWREVKR